MYYTPISPSWLETLVNDLSRSSDSSKISNALLEALDSNTVIPNAFFKYFEDHGRWALTLDSKGEKRYRMVGQGYQFTTQQIVFAERMVGISVRSFNNANSVSHPWLSAGVVLDEGALRLEFVGEMEVIIKFAADKKNFVQAGDKLSLQSYHQHPAPCSSCWLKDELWAIEAVEEYYVSLAAEVIEFLEDEHSEAKSLEPMSCCSLFAPEQGIDGFTKVDSPYQGTSLARVMMAAKLISDSDCGKTSQSNKPWIISELVANNKVFHLSVHPQGHLRIRTGKSGDALGTTVQTLDIPGLN